MYENNYNYINVPEDNKDKENKKKGGAGRTVATVLAAALIGGASGFGGAYLHDMTAPAAQAPYIADTAAPAVSDDRSEDKDVTPPRTSSVVSTLLTAPAEDGELSTKQIVEKVSPSVVGVHSEFANQGQSTGTGIILSAEGYIITNAHVVQTTENEKIPNNGGYNSFGGGYDIFDYFFGGGYTTRKTLKPADKVSVVLSTDEDNEYEAEIIGADENSDLAVLKIKDADKLNLAAAEFGSSDELTMGDTAIAIGYPMGLGLSTSKGIVSGLNRTMSIELSNGGTAEMTLIQTDTAINPGNSGGPLINGRGQVVGITSSKIASSTVDGLGFAIPISDAMPLISDLMSTGHIITPQIGINGTDINNAIMRYYNLPVDKGVMVVSVSEGGGAEKAGICAGDVIIAADGKELSSMKELTSAKSGKRAGDAMVLTLARADGNIDVTIILTGEDDIKPETEISSN